MQRLNHIDLNNELLKFKNKQVIPKERALIKAKKQGLEKTLSTFALKLKNELISYINDSLAMQEEQRDPIKPLCKIIEDIYLFLDNLRKNNSAFLNRTICEELLSAIKTANTMIISRVHGGPILDTDRLYLIKITIATIALIHTDFCEYTNNNHLSETNLTPYIPELLQRYCELLIVTKNFEETKPLLRLNKALLHLWNTKLNGKFLGLMMTHHLLSTQLEIKTNHLDKARRQAFKAIQCYERAEGGIISYMLSSVLKECTLLSYQNKIYSDAVFFADLCLEHMAEIEILLANYDESYFLNMGIASNHEKWKKELVIDKKFLTFLISESKQKLLEINKETLKSIAVATKFEIEWLANNQFSISIPESTTNLEALTHQLNRKNIICYFDSQSNKIIFDSLLDIKLESLKKIIYRWSSQIESNKQRQITNEKINHAEVVSLTPQNPLTSVATNNEPTEIKPKKEKIEKPVNTTTTTPPTETQNNDIHWGDNLPIYSKNDSGEVYKLYGQTAHNQYLFINHGFFSQLNMENPDAARTLVNICERGKVINNSQGNKGIIIEGKDVKIKDSSKAYRFFGQVIATTTHKEKTCQLIEVNTWNSDPH